MKGKTTDITRSPQVFLREVQLENDSKTLMNHHRLLHAWMAELRSASPTDSIGQNGWTPKYIIPAHDKVVARLTELIPGFNHSTPIQAASALPRLLPITVKENAVRIVSAGAGQQFGIALDRDGDWAQMLAAAFGQGDLRIYSEGSKIPSDATMDQPAYHLVLMPVDEWTSKGRSVDVANTAYEKLLGAGGKDGRYIEGKSVLRASVLPGMEIDDLNKAARKAAEWVVSGDEYPKHLLGGAIAAASSGGTLAQEGIRLFRRLVVPYDDESIIEDGNRLIRLRSVELVKELNDPDDREKAMRDFVTGLAQEMK